jgi:hypothetical protein
MVVLRTDDLDATSVKVRASGAEVLQEPIDQPWARATARSETPRATWRAVRRRPERSRREQSRHRAGDQVPVRGWLADRSRAACLPARRPKNDPSPSWVPEP